MSGDHTKGAYILVVNGKPLDSNCQHEGDPLVMSYEAAMFCVSVAHHFWVDDVEDPPDIHLHAAVCSADTRDAVLVMQPKTYGGM